MVLCFFVPHVGGFGAGEEHAVRAARVVAFDGRFWLVCCCRFGAVLFGWCFSRVSEARARSTYRAITAGRGVVGVVAQHSLGAVSCFVSFSHFSLCAPPSVSLVGRHLVCL